MELKTIDTKSENSADAPKPPAGEPPPPAVEQLAYAGLLREGQKAAIIILLLTFVLYVLGITEPHVKLEKLPSLWSLPADKFMNEAGLSAGWGLNGNSTTKPSVWGLLGKGDYMNMIGIALLATISIGCYVRILPIFIRKKDYLYMGIAVAEIVLLVLAATGVAGGHH